MTRDIDMLNAIHETLRGLTVSIAAAARIEPGHLATLLQTFASNPSLQPIAQQMLNDLAQGLDVLSTRRPQ